jgi:hypothetical protein
MKKILSERNIAGILFILVMVAFSFAHEDSKKRSSLYNVSASRMQNTPSSVSENISAQKPAKVSYK